MFSLNGRTLGADFMHVGLPTTKIVLPVLSVVAASSVQFNLQLTNLSSNTAASGRVSCHAAAAAAMMTLS